MEKTATCSERNKEKKMNAIGTNFLNIANYILQPGWQRYKGNQVKQNL